MRARAMWGVLALAALLLAPAAMGYAYLGEMRVEAERDPVEVSPGGESLVRVRVHVSLRSTVSACEVGAELNSTYDIDLTAEFDELATPWLEAAFDPPTITFAGTCGERERIVDLKLAADEAAPQDARVEVRLLATPECDAQDCNARGCGAGCSLHRAESILNLTTPPPPPPADADASPPGSLQAENASAPDANATTPQEDAPPPPEGEEPRLQGDAEAPAATSAFPWWLPLLAGGRRAPPAAGKYRIERELGRGAHGTTYLATHVDLRRRVVLKAVRPEWAADEGARRQLEREAQLLASLDHPNVTRVYDIERTPDVTYLVMEHVERGSLADRLARGPLPLADALRATEDVLRGLAYIHARGILHRDVKPSNVLVARDGGAKIADFGVARAPDAAATTAIPQAGTVGTPLYMAPEQLAGGAVDARADLYAAGALLFELLTCSHYLGERPADAAQLRQLVLTAPPRLPLADVPAGVNAWMARALEKRPQARFASAAEALAALAAATRANAQPA